MPHLLLCSFSSEVKWQTKESIQYWPVCHKATNDACCMYNPYSKKRLHSWLKCKLQKNALIFQIPQTHSLGLLCQIFHFVILKWFLLESGTTMKPCCCNSCIMWFNIVLLKYGSSPLIKTLSRWKHKTCYAFIHWRCLFRCVSWKRKKDELDHRTVLFSTLFQSI